MLPNLCLAALFFCTVAIAADETCQANSCELCVMKLCVYIQDDTGAACYSQKQISDSKMIPGTRYDRSNHCPSSQTSSSSSTEGSSTSPIVIVLVGLVSILIVAGAAFYFRRRKQSTTKADKVDETSNYVGVQDGSPFVTPIQHSNLQQSGPGSPGPRVPRPTRSKGSCGFRSTASSSGSYIFYDTLENAGSRDLHAALQQCAGREKIKEEIHQVTAAVDTIEEDKETQMDAKVGARKKSEVSIRTTNVSRSTASSTGSYVFYDTIERERDI